ncbi:hypothetical protein GPECTOR_8g114 [Gonium pectorale]|uniref:Probable magnesium transporter n=1 Tax=Gonium pectorale TaxID=33097 RepID=A0A150GTP1_GONPE|nr:hypothetical protein GPECTOR_8g114 [Gonium pectorale]|eukprot:KXZ52720.1 hypothetical protein GPECTOR_8g114 [Gonium pectorale]
MAPGAEGESQDLWYVGAIINVIGSIAINLGTNLMKLGHNKRAKMDLPDDKKPPVGKIKEWAIGMAFFSAGNILNFVSFGFAAQSLLAALGSIQFVSNVIFASFVLHEPINRLVLIATASIVGGCVLLVVFGNQSSATYTVKQLTQLYGKPAYVTYLCLLGVGVVGGYLLYLHGQKMVNKNGQRGFWYAILPVAYSVFSALIGTQSVLFSKSMSVILRLTFSGDNQLGNWYTWLVLPLFLLTAIFWITRLNKGLRMFPAMVIVPVMQISWTLFSIVSGMLYFQEYVGFTPLKSIMFPIGVLVVFVGVFLLTQSGASQTRYQKMEEAAATKAAKRDAAATAFGAEDFDGARREASIDASSSEGATAAAAPSIGAAEVLEPDLEAAVRKAPAEAGPSGLSAETERTLDSSPSKLEANSEPVGGSPSMMSNVKRRLKGVQDRLSKDLLGVETRAGFRLAMGLGDEGVPAISLFAMPTMIDYAKAVDDTPGGLKPIAEEVEVSKSTSSFVVRPEGRSQEDLVSSSFGSSPTLPRPATAPASPRGGLGRTFIDRAERAAKTSIEALKKAPSNLQRAVREKQGYGSLHDDEETGLLELAVKSDGRSSR